MLKGGRAAAAQPGAGREGVKKGEASWWQSRCSGWWGWPRGQGTGSCLAWGTKGQGLQGWDHIQGLGLEGQGWLLGCRSSVTPKWQLSGGTWTWSLPMALRMVWPSSA